MQIRAPSRLTPLPLLLLLLLPLVLLLVRFPGRAAGLPVVFRSYIRTPWNRTQDECLLPDIIINNIINNRTRYLVREYIRTIVDGKMESILIPGTLTQQVTW